jgi:hypothetical protein
MTTLSVAWIFLGLGLAAGFMMGRWAAEADTGVRPLPVLAKR